MRYNLQWAAAVVIRDGRVVLCAEILVKLLTLSDFVVGGGVVIVKSMEEAFG